MAGIEKAYLEPEKGPKLPCLFNPQTLIIQKRNSWSSPSVARQDAPSLIFDQGQSGTLTIDLILDTTDSGKPVTDYTDRLLSLMKVDESLPDSPESKNKAGRPPWVRFRWGRTHSFKAVIESANITFNYFSSEGKPLRATANLVLLQFLDEAKWPLQNPTSQTPELHTIHTVRAGETLDRIAFEHYGDSALWTQIARVNRIIDPLALTTGAMLQIPDQEVVSLAR